MTDKQYFVFIPFNFIANSFDISLFIQLIFVEWKVNIDILRIAFCWNTDVVVFWKKNSSNFLDDIFSRKNWKRNNWKFHLLSSFFLITNQMSVDVVFFYFWKKYIAMHFGGSHVWIYVQCFKWDTKSADFYLLLWMILMTLILSLYSLTTSRVHH